MQDICKHYPEQILEVVLFGSKARGDDNPESDIDFLVITNSESYDFRSALGEDRLRDFVELQRAYFSTHIW